MFSILHKLTGKPACSPWPTYVQAKAIANRLNNYGLNDMYVVREARS
jgi:hypothetical protein